PRAYGVPLRQFDVEDLCAFRRIAPPAVLPHLDREDGLALPLAECHIAACRQYEQQQGECEDAGAAGAENHPDKTRRAAPSSSRMRAMACPPCVVAAAGTALREERRTRRLLL